MVSLGVGEAMSTDDAAMESAHEFHRRRAEFEMEKALSARKLSVSVIHLDLAKIHRQRREQLIADNRRRLSVGDPQRIFGTDKES